jgi:uncharacterized nucleotidyltransferase DUF6036
VCEVLLTREELESGLQALVDELVRLGVGAKIYLVGGAAMVFHTERERLTDDVDGLYSPIEAIDNAVAQIAEARRWPTAWLNDAAKMWESHFTTQDDWQLLIARGEVKIFVAKPALLFAMKLQAGRGTRDLDDVALLFAICDIPSLEEAIEVFDKYYPSESIAPKARRFLQDHFANNPQNEQ